MRTTSDEEASTTPGGFAVGLLALALATGGSAALSIGRLVGARLPGCGAESACDEAARSSWGSLPWLGWPLAFVGSAWFAALLAAFVRGRGALPRGLLVAARSGGAVSLLLTVVMLAGDLLCPYCLLVHAANLVFVLRTVRQRTVPPAGRGVVATFVVVLVAVLAILLPVDARRKAGRRAIEEADLARAVEQAGQRQEAEPFTGRYRVGLAEARVRMVIFTDYQCPDCKRLEAQASAVLETRSDASLSVKHFPFCADCNRRVRELGRNKHPNACWAARAAEAAGILGGDEGFFRMHRWLFELAGEFDDAALSAGLVQLGFEREEFLHVLRGEETLRRIEADVDEGLALGLHRTPMVFLNGVELAAWSAPRALERAALAIAASDAGAATAAMDRPPTAVEKLLADWRAAPRLPVPVPTRATFGAEPAAGRVEVTVWGDYLDELTRELDARLRAEIERTPGVTYSFLPFPLETGCNPHAKRTLHAGACLAARAALAAERAGGRDSFRRMHAWLVEHAEPHDRAALEKAALALGIDTERFATELDADLGELREGVDLAERLGLHAVPFLLIDDRHVPRWRLEGEALPERMLREAAGAE